MEMAEAVVAADTADAVGQTPPLEEPAAGELLLSLLGVNQARNRRAEEFRVAGCAVIGQRDGAESR